MVLVFNNIEIVNQLLVNHKLMYIRKDYKDPERSLVYVFGVEAKEDFDKIMASYQA